MFNNWRFVLLKSFFSKITGFLGLKERNNSPNVVVSTNINEVEKPKDDLIVKDIEPKVRTNKKSKLKRNHGKISINELIDEDKPKAVDNWDPSVFNVPEIEGKTRFTDLNLHSSILHAIYDLGFKYCTDVQALTMPHSLQGKDITAQAQTGTGKTAAFLITIFNHLVNNPLTGKQKHGTPRAVILAPTRELAIQIEKDAQLLGKYLSFNVLKTVGGIDYQKQQNLLSRLNTDILIATPGRLIDFIDKKAVDLKHVEILVIDEADRMLNMGFLPSVRQIVLSTPPKAQRQTMFFTATMNFEVKNLAESWTKDAVDVAVNPEEKTVDTIEQITYITTVDEKPTLLYNLVIKKNFDRVLVFANRRDEARQLKDTFTTYGISCALLSGDVEQATRIRRLEMFRSGKIRVLVATDVAARGIHVENITHVINYNIPQDIEEYIHRIGRTGRAGATGIAISFADEESGYELMKLEELLGKKFECIYPEEDLLTPIPEQYIKPKATKSISAVKRSFKRNDRRKDIKKRFTKNSNKLKNNPKDREENN